MFLAKWNYNLVLGDDNGYYPIEFNWNTFFWSSEISVDYVNVKDFRKKIKEYPINENAKIICVGRNYAKHVSELGNETPLEPLLFWKPSSSLLAPHGSIILPKESSKVQYETELVAVIGKSGKNVPEYEAMNHVLGYTIGLDITARDLQKKDKTWFRGKSFDTFAPIGPVIVPKNNLNLDDCKIELFINDKLKQMGNTRDFIFKLPFLIHYISQIITLNPGDIIFTGTPEGVGNISSNDSLTARIENIGELNVSVK